MRVPPLLAEWVSRESSAACKGGGRKVATGVTAFPNTALYLLFCPRRANFLPKAACREGGLGAGRGRSWLKCGDWLGPLHHAPTRILLPFRVPGSPSPSPMDRKCQQHESVREFPGLSHPRLQRSLDPIPFCFRNREQSQAENTACFLPCTPATWQGS